MLDSKQHDTLPNQPRLQVPAYSIDRVCAPYPGEDCEASGESMICNQVWFSTVPSFLQSRFGLAKLNVAEQSCAELPGEAKCTGQERENSTCAGLSPAGLVTILEMLTYQKATGNGGKSAGVFVSDRLRWRNAGDTRIARIGLGHPVQRQDVNHGTTSFLFPLPFFSGAGFNKSC
jgi:hypothetical protein